MGNGHSHAANSIRRQRPPKPPLAAGPRGPSGYPMRALNPSEPTPGPADARAEAPGSLAVTIPTRSRPDRLARCLKTLAAAREMAPFTAYVCDSSPAAEDRAAVREVCARYEWVELSTHDGRNISAARNACVAAASEELLVNVDDDLELEPQAIERLLARYDEGSGLRVVSGSVSWGTHWTTPVKTRAIGYGRAPRDGEQPDFIAGAIYLIPRRLALALPWNERIEAFDDIFAGALWRCHGVQMLFAPEARALHPELPAAFDPERVGEGARGQRWHIYVLLFDALFANRDLRRALSYETLGFLASAKLYLRRPSWAIEFLRSWAIGHFRLFADRRYLRALVRKEIDRDAA